MTLAFPWLGAEAGRHLGLSLALSALLVTTASAQVQAADAPELRFSRFFHQPIGPRGLEPSATLRAADGQRVQLQGYMVAQDQPTPGQFLLTPRPVRMSQHADGEADDLPPATVLVLLDPGQRQRIVPHQAGRLALAGQLMLGRMEDASGRVSWVRLILDPDALAEHGASAPAAGPLHTR